jgi:hypothetical protein
MPDVAKFPTSYVFSWIFDDVSIFFHNVVNI